MARPVDYGTAARRWAGLGPYYAMFPTDFADRVVRTYTSVGDLVLDPFAGLGTSIFSAAAQNRAAVGVEINPVGFVYGKAKLAPAEKGAVADRLRRIGRASHAAKYEERSKSLPIFFQRCFSARVRSFLLAAREHLDWRRSTVDRTTMALILVYLHGKAGAALSNQMRQTKSMSPDYAIRWWAEHGMSPPNIDPVEFLLSRLDWRYARGTPSCSSSTIYLGSSLVVLPRVAARVARGDLPRAKLLFTSPPYHGITNYHYDQWLRLWLLGGPPHARRTGNGRRGKFEHRENYKILLDQVFRHAKRILHRDATIYVRTDAREFTRETTVSVLREVFPNKSLSSKRRPLTGATQTQLFGDYEKKRGEVDLVLRPA
jgi:hypothetical protein